MFFLEEFIRFLVIHWISIYLTLAITYLAFGKFVEWFNRKHLEKMRIQNKDCPKELIQRDIRQSLKSLMSIAGMFAAGLALRDMGFGLGVLELNLINGIVWMLISLALFDTWFYWGHRTIHRPRLYKKIHQWHHRASTPTVWSNNSDTFLDNLFCQSYWFFAPILLPAPTFILLLHKFYDQATGMLGHAGHEYAAGKFSAAPSPMIGTSFHDLHHSTFNYNFATHFSWWDRMMGTLHPDYDRMIKDFPKTHQGQAAQNG